MKKIVCASGNPNKIREIENITKNFGLTVISRKDAGVPVEFDVVEDGDTFEANSLKKAAAIMELTGMPAIADDSGLMVDALGGEPGVYSARFAGEDATDFENNEKLLRKMEGIPMEQRTGRFVSVITLVRPGKEPLIARGECEGHILTEYRGNGGFGYDPLFLPIEAEETFGEISSEKKDQISHRARALAKLAELLQKEDRQA